jgi:hypothetical protein
LIHQTNSRKRVAIAVALVQKSTVNREGDKTRISNLKSKEKNFETQRNRTLQYLHGTSYHTTVGQQTTPKRKRERRKEQGMVSAPFRKKESKKKRRKEERTNRIFGGVFDTQFFLVNVCNDSVQSHPVLDLKIKK